MLGIRIGQRLIPAIMLELFQELETTVQAAFLAVIFIIIKYLFLSQAVVLQF